MTLSIEDLEALAAEHKALDYAENLSVDLSHKLSDQIRAALSLMDDTDLALCLSCPDLGDWAAYVVLETPERGNSVRETAIKRLRSVSEGGGPQASAAQWKLKDLEKDA